MHGLYVMWWLREGSVSLPVLATILAVGDLAVTALEVPTGWLADRRGHRTSLIIGSILQIAGILLAWLGRGVTGVLTSCLLIAAGDAFRSGADQALLYRSCAAIGRERDFQRIEGRTRSGQLVALVALVVAGGVIVDQWGFAAGWLIELALCAAGLAIACAMAEPPPAQRTPTEAVATRSSESLPLGSIAALILPAALLGSVASAATFLAQSNDQASAAAITAFIAVVTLAEAAGSGVGSLFAAGIQLQWLLLAIGVAVTAAAIIVPAVFIPAVISLSFLMGLAYPIRAALIQRVAADTVRARAASIASACDKALATLALIGAGWRPRRS
jgi:MFS transporter